jgi:non-ribosomal peptide synthetase component F
VDGAAIPAAIPRVAPDATACVMYGSRRTGQPAGRVLSHRDIVRLVRGAESAGRGQRLRLPWSGSRACHASTLEAWGPLLQGGEVVLVDDATVRDARRMREALTLSGASALCRPRLKAAF